MKNKPLFITLFVIMVTFFLVWPVSFIHIYTKNNTRIDASFWINQNLKQGSGVAIEHWDDPLPLMGSQQYNMITLPLYDPDTSEKWTGISQQLQQTNYIILASNRLYTPLQKLTDCPHLPPYKCYPITAEYYKRLFTEKNVIPEYNPQHNEFIFSDNIAISNNGSEKTAKFQEIKEFTDYPTIPFLNIPINDQGADESFTVYDHPKVIIFKKL
jgi:hypothetical protein